MFVPLLALLGTTLASDCTQVAGNWYCDETSQVVYSGLGGVAGSYSRVTNMDAESCTCTKASQPFSGPLSPLDEDLSVHFRGPVRIAQFAAYTMATPKKRKRSHKKRSSPQRAGNVVKRDQVVYTVIPPISTTFNVLSAVPTTTAVDAALTTTGTAIGLPSEISTMITSPTTTSTTPLSTLSQTATTASTPVETSQTIWQRNSYYNAASGQLDNAVFMNNMGGILSGTWSPCFGNSLSYASSSGNYTAASSEVLSDVLLPSNTEVIIFSGEACTMETCGYVSDGVPAYRGFAGADKLFLFDFSMPSEADQIGAFNGDMPAIWLLNGQIPRSQQYGACSCWQTGCGELDLFEILSGGSDRLTTTFHSTLGAGGATSDYFPRPTQGYQKAAVLFLGATKQIQIILLDPSVAFDDALAYDVFESWQQGRTSAVTLVS